MRPVLLLGHDASETFGTAPEGLAAGGLEVLPNHALDGDPLPPLDEVAGIVMFGGAMNVDTTDRYPFLDEQRAYVRKAVETGVPYLGICLGAQMLARAMDRTVFPAGIREIGFGALHPTPDAADDPLLSVFEDGDRLFHWHEDTFELPEGATVLGTGDDVHLQAFRIGDLAWGTQFHFEVDHAEFEIWLEAAGEDGVRAWGSTSEELRQQAARHLATQETRARGVFRRFADVIQSSA
jgi:GMP synthase (glutamine-hydrolysing)